MRPKILPVCVLLLLLGSFTGCIGTGSKMSTVIAGEDLAPHRIPLTFSNDGLPIAEVAIGNNKVHLGVSTGAASVTLAIKPALLERLDVEYLDKYQTMRDVQGNTTKAQYISIPSARLGEAGLIDTVAIEELRDFAPADGILGNQVLRHFHVLFDYAASQMILYPKIKYPEELNLGNWMAVPFHYGMFGITIAGKLSGQNRTVKFCFDTGCGALAGRDDLGLLRRKYAPKTEAIRSAEYEDGDYSWISTQVNLADFDLGNFDFLLGDFKLPPTAAILGRNILINHRVFLDFEDNKLFLQSY